MKKWYEVDAEALLALMVGILLGVFFLRFVLELG